MIDQPTPGARDASSEDARLTWPFFVLLFVSLLVVYGIALAGDAALRQPARLVPFTALFVVHAVVHWFVIRVPANRRWAILYFGVQGAFALSIGLMIKVEMVAIGLYLPLVGEAVGVLWPNLRATALTTLFVLALMLANVAVTRGSDALLGSLPTIGLMTLFVLIYVVLFLRQAEAREQAQTLLSELEVAHRRLQGYAARVEELTIAQERERMARELHDTLAQGVAGLILQLEAVDSHLESGAPNKAQAVVQQALQRARTTLDEARRAIQALRPAALEQGGLVDALGAEVDRFAAGSGVRATFEVDGAVDLPPDVAQDALRIVQEGLTNAARHAHAAHVLVRLAESGGALEVTVQDDGVGFDPGRIEAGSFGLAGMRERAARLGGELDVESGPGRGTRIVLRVPAGGEA